MKKPSKKVWVIKMTDETSAAGPGKFWMLDETGEMQWSPVEEQSRTKMANFAFDHGADEVLHDYDLVKVDGSGSQK